MMGHAFKFGRIKTATGLVKAPTLQFEDLDSMFAQYKPDGVLRLANRGLKTSLSVTIREALGTGADIEAAQLAFQPTEKVRLSKATGRSRKSPARIAKEAVKEGRISAAELAAFLASKGVS